MACECFCDKGNALTEAIGQISKSPARSVVRFNLPDAPQSPNPPMTEVENLCSALKQARQNRKLLKIFLSPRGGLCSSHVSPTRGVVVCSGDTTYEVITLEEIILHTSRDGFSTVKWNLVQRMNLSFSLASSLLQLYSRPRLAEPWTKRAICFQRLRPS